jgi:hypothetical protein
LRHFTPTTEYFSQDRLGTIIRKGWEERSFPQEKLALRVEKTEVDAKVAALKSELDEAEAEAEVLDAALGAAKP